MSGAHIAVIIYKNGILSFAEWIDDKSILKRVKEILAKQGKKELEDIIYYHKEPWAKKITDAWVAVDSFAVYLELDKDYDHPFGFSGIQN